MEEVEGVEGCGGDEGGGGGGGGVKGCGGGVEWGLRRMVDERLVLWRWEDVLFGGMLWAGDGWTLTCMRKGLMGKGGSWVVVVDGGHG